MNYKLPDINKTFLSPVAANNHTIDFDVPITRKDINMKNLQIQKGHSQSKGLSKNLHTYNCVSQESIGIDYPTGTMKRSELDLMITGSN